MTTRVDRFEQQLRSKFNVKIFCDLSTVSDDPGGLLTVLESVYQCEYDTNDRLVFYTSHAIPNELIAHLYETTNFLDISNWFVLVCGPNVTQETITDLCVEYSSDPVPFQFLAVNLEPTANLHNNFVLPKTICSIPWNNVEILPNGDITPCCTTTKIKYGNVQTVSLQDAFHSEPAKKLREELLQGLKPKACQKCWEDEDKNLTSTRMHNIKRTKKAFLSKYLNEPKIATVDIKFNNTCNFKCRICNSNYSSAFALEEHKFRGRPMVVQNNWSENTQFLDQFEQLLPAINNIDMYGGEPFLIKKFEKVLKLAIDLDHAKHIRLHYNSNGSVWPENFIKLWPHFKQVDIHFSIDAIGSQFELQRGGKWSDVESNILRLKDLNLSNLSISIMPSVSIMNIFYIDQVYDWATQHGFQIFVNYVRGEGLEIKYLTAQAKTMIIEKYQNHPWSEMQSILATIKNLPDSDGKEFYQKTKWFDQVRQENFAENHLEIAKAMNYM